MFFAPATLATLDNMPKQQAFNLGRTATAIAVVVLSFGQPWGAIPASIGLALVWYGSTQ